MVGRETVQDVRPAKTIRAICIRPADYLLQVRANTELCLVFIRCFCEAIPFMQTLRMFGPVAYRRGDWGAGRIPDFASKCLKPLLIVVMFGVCSIAVMLDVVFLLM